MPLQAAKQYFVHRRTYEASIEAIEGLAVPDDARKMLKTACLQHVRQKFRGVSKALTDRLTCRFSAICEAEDDQDPETEHAIPLAAIHNRILGIEMKGRRSIPNQAIRDLFPDPLSIQTFVTKFVIGVHVTKSQHTALNTKYKSTMPPGWNWEESMPPGWTVEAGEPGGDTWYDRIRSGWATEPPPEGLGLLMARYKNVKFHPKGYCEHCPA